MTMRMTLGRWWWVSSLLVMAVGADLSADLRIDLKNKAIRLVREDFHKTNNVSNAFQVSIIKRPIYQEQSDGTFVQVKFRMKRTNCKNQNWMNENCAPLRITKKTFDCLGCFTFNSNGDVEKTGYQRCVLRRHVKTNDVKQERHKACEKLKLKKTKHEQQVHKPGSYDFQR
ncbi:retinoic acid receptor responder protein 2-like isoform X2 [Dendropsophus ebraccatus]